MRKVPTLFKRDPDDLRHVLDEVTPGCEWVLAGEGIATRKYDGTCVMFDGRDWWARREVKPGKTPPPGWVEVDADETTGKRVGWEPVAQSPFAKFRDEAEDRAIADGRVFAPGTYELCGPKVNGNPERFERHLLINHRDDTERIDPKGRTPVQMVEDSGLAGWEGIVWHHPDGRMAKLKARDLA